jgi:hypothetical protein
MEKGLLFMDTSNRMRKVDQISPLVDYLRKNFAKGYKLNDLKWTLISQGYSKIEIDKAMVIIDQEQAAEDKRRRDIEEATKKMTMPEVEVVKEEKKGFWRSIFG